MGLNMDLTRLLKAPKTLICPHCEQSTQTYFDDYDIECGNPNPSPGQWHLKVYCTRCDNTIHVMSIMDPEWIVAGLSDA